MSQPKRTLGAAIGPISGHASRRGLFWLSEGLQPLGSGAPGSRQRAGPLLWS